MTADRTASSVVRPERLTWPQRAPDRRMQRDVIVVGASAGGVEALGTLVAGLPAELGAAVFVVLHVLPGGVSVLPKILARAGNLPVAAAVDGEPVERGRVYVAPADHHMLLRDGCVQLARGPRENGHRPAVDPLFRSAADAYGSRVIGVVLSGALDDGTAGLRMISDAGGMALVQDPADALYPGMPISALDRDPSARAVPIHALAHTICTAVDEPLVAEEMPQENLAIDAGKSDPDSDERSDDDPRAGVLTSITCPECGGALWEHDDEGVLRFKCHVGHAYSAESLEVAQSQSLEGALWAALRSLQERADLFRRLARRTGGDERLEVKARTADDHASVLRSLVTSFGREPGAAGEADRMAD
jgi:two-component system, chemotaxis family, protein-glutamate methylesterase/glutaminase